MQTASLILLSILILSHPLNCFFLVNINDGITPLINTKKVETTADICSIVSKTSTAKKNKPKNNIIIIISQHKADFGS